MEAMNNVVNFFQTNFSDFSMQGAGRRAANGMADAAGEGFSAATSAVRSMFNSFAESAPTVIGALIVLIVGWIVAKMVKWAVQKVLKAINFDGITDKVGINKYLQQGGIKKSSSGLASTLVYWMIMLTVLNLFFNKLGIEQVSDLFNQVVMYIPKIIIACVLMVVGMYLAEMVSGIVVGALKSGGVANAETFGKFANFAVMFFVISIVLSTLGIGGGIIETLVGIVLGSLGLALSLAFGLGGKDWAAGLIDRYLKF